MNRAAKREAKRAARRNAPRGNIQTPRAWLNALCRASDAAVTADMHADLVLPMLLDVTKLERGELETLGFVRLVEMNATAYFLAQAAFDGQWLEGDALAAAEAAKRELEQAADALIAIGERRKRTERYGASGDELLRLRAAAHWLDQLVGATSQGLVLQALQRAEVMTAKALGGRP